MARNFYQKDGSYYYSDNNQKILNEQELQTAASDGGTEVAPTTSAPAERAYTSGTGANPDQYTPEQATQQYQQNTQQAEIDATYANAVASHPSIATLIQGGSTLQEIIEALQSGDLSGIVDWQGQPFDIEDQRAALSQANEDTKLYYNALQAKDTADAEATLAQKKSDYQDYLINSGQAFEADKSKSDQKAADSGVLFSGGRVQKEKNLERAYNQDQAYTQDKIGRQIGNTARDFQYKYGNDEGQTQGLSQYFNLGGNTFDAKKAQGGVGASALSNIYNPQGQQFQGTQNTARSAANKVRAAGYLRNKGNKLLSTGKNNQF